MSYSFNLTNRDMTQVKRLSTAERLIMTERTRLPCWRQRGRLWGRRGDGPSSLHLWPHQRVIGPRPATLSAVYSLKSTIRTRNTWATSQDQARACFITVLVWRAAQFYPHFCYYISVWPLSPPTTNIYIYILYNRPSQILKKWIMGYLCSETQRTYLLN